MSSPRQRGDGVADVLLSALATGIVFWAIDITDTTLLGNSMTRWGELVVAIVVVYGGWFIHVREKM